MPTPDQPDDHHPRGGDGDAASVASLAHDYRRMRDEIARVIIGQEAVVEDLLTGLLARGHVLLIGVPGLAKTLLVSTVARILHLDFRRIQFTPDMMPSDITGTDILQDDPETGRRRFTFIAGPLFANIILADEINRTPPKTQAALLEAMQERHVTAGGTTYPLPDPFFVLATQNPIEQEGTYPLPEAQLDRFMLNVLVPYPTADEELEILRRTTGDATPAPQPTLSGERILALQHLVRRVPVADHVFRYAHDIVRATRPNEPEATELVRKWVSWGAGPRRPVADPRRQGPRRALGPAARRDRRYPPRRSDRAAAPDRHDLPRRVRGHRPRQGHRAPGPGRPRRDREGHGSPLLDQLTPAPPRAEPSRVERADLHGASPAMIEPPAAGFDPTAVARFGRLELIARLVVEGVMTGLHRSPFKGSSVEFAEHRQYGPGDEIRHIDWRTFGKTDRYFVKEYEEETNLRAYLVVNSSGSMAYAGRTVAKFEFARRLAASLAYLMIGQRDAVGLVTFDTSVRAMIPPRSSPGQFSVVCSELEKTQTGGEARPGRILHALAERIRRRGLVVILSDGFDDPEDLASAVRHLRHDRHEVLFLHTLAPEEEEFPFRHPARFRNLERTGHDLRVNPLAMRAEYLERFHAFCNTLKERLHAMGADYHRASTAEPVDRILLDYLSTRAHRGRGRGG